MLKLFIMENFGDVVSEVAFFLSGVRYSWWGDKASNNIFWLKDEFLEVSDNLPDPDVIAQELVEDLEAALEQFREIATDLGERKK